METRIPTRCPAIKCISLIANDYSWHCTDDRGNPKRSKGGSLVCTWIVCGMCTSVISTTQTRDDATSPLFIDKSTSND
jgi:hypothetical protein